MIHRLSHGQLKQIEIDNLLREKLNKEIEIYLQKTEAIVEDICEGRTLSQHMITHLVCELHAGLADINDPL